MPRTDDDTWSITESVGATALFVASARAFEARKADRLATDQFAEPLAKAAGGEWAQALRGEGPIYDVLGQGWFGEHFQRFQGARTKYFDEVFARAAAAGVLQFVILASGLDSRAYRLAYPNGSRVFELDQPQVLEYKARTLSEIGAKPATGRVTVPIDLRHDWPAALTASGFDPAKPTAWLIEGLLMYLPPEAETLLFERVVALSAPGSWAGIEHMQPIEADAMVQSMRAFEPGPARGGAGSHEDFADLIYNDPRPDPVQWFAAKGWAAEGVPLAEHMAQLGCPVEAPVPGQPVPATPFSTTTLVAARLQP
ncbi:SAM-dependent methyltransferase [Segniliparus rugosus]|uniref:S-adenosyl-L-methionine-dependent methyltransferase n=1 Tax=Segniliparus rugosus (strain ATCC BAA-974 / DSM 45345 / CCUG 50838 / CIP 108380 / JCM 13579 / CDC 945) TaxID=679197 RepID=E5XUJ3_SEGRC|nr:SAM-dependent methyltransferase [Segniliparus rugosus]EFV11972.1 hypothetical protein HMPREF9336_03165 [Segniliparus rugosus ATCC BAA-974]